MEMLHCGRKVEICKKHFYKFVKNVFSKTKQQRYYLNKFGIAYLTAHIFKCEILCRVSGGVSAKYFRQNNNGTSAMKSLKTQGFLQDRVSAHVTRKIDGRKDTGVFHAEWLLVTEYKNQSDGKRLWECWTLLLVWHSPFFTYYHHSTTAIAQSYLALFRSITVYHKLQSILQIIFPLYE